MSDIRIESGRHRSFYSFAVAETCISLADVVYIMVVTIEIYRQSGSAFIASLFPFLKALAGIAAGLTAPLLLRKFRSSGLLVVLQAVKALLLTAVVFGFPFIASRTYILLLFVLLIALLEGWGNPLLASFPPKLVGPSELVRANSLLSMVSQTAQFVGYTLTGSIILALGPRPTLSVSVGLWWLSVLCLADLARRFKREEQPEPIVRQTKWEAVREGWRLLWRNRTLRIVTLMDVLEGMAGTIWVGAVSLVYVQEALHRGEEWWGYINASYFVGTITGGLLAWLLARMIQGHLIMCMAAGSFLFSLFTLLYGLNGTPWLALLLCVAMGPAYQIRDVAQQTALQTSMQASALPNVYASRSILLSTVTGVSMALVGLASDTLGVRMVYVLGAAVIALSALLSFVLLRFQK
ncbi:MFS transporter [Cohnella thermotolerans]|jgi:MFS family permease|uniref:MFS transporter n=1 Tax=Cohnella thermotolerans TaxID=329858 RepID=UPI00047B3A43|nr:MFS transporter [Cohnella thermotolerans]